MTFNETMDDIAKVRGSRRRGARVGFVIGFAQAGLALLRHDAHSAVHRALRSFVGRTILLSLEILVAADLIRTVPSTRPRERQCAGDHRADPHHSELLARRARSKGRLPWRAKPLGRPPTA